MIPLISDSISLIGVSRRRISIRTIVIIVCLVVIIGGVSGCFGYQYWYEENQQRQLEKRIQAMKESHIEGYPDKALHEALSAETCTIKDWEYQETETQQILSYVFTYEGCEQKADFRYGDDEELVVGNWFTDGVERDRVSVAEFCDALFSEETGNTDASSEEGISDFHADYMPRRTSRYTNWPLYASDEDYDPADMDAPRKSILTVYRSGSHSFMFSLSKEMPFQNSYSSETYYNMESTLAGIAVFEENEPIAIYRDPEHTIYFDCSQIEDGTIFIEGFEDYKLLSNEFSLGGTERFKPSKNEEENQDGTGDKTGSETQEETGEKQSKENPEIDKDYRGNISCPLPPVSATYKIEQNDNYCDNIILHIENIDDANFKFYFTKVTLTDEYLSENIKKIDEEVIFTEHIAHYNGDGYYEYKGEDYHLYFKYYFVENDMVSGHKLEVYGQDGLYPTEKYCENIQYNGLEGNRFQRRDVGVGWYSKVVIER